jgi:hypothetical protein
MAGKKLDFAERKEERRSKDMVKRFALEHCRIDTQQQHQQQQQQRQQQQQQQQLELQQQQLLLQMQMQQQQMEFQRQQQQQQNNLHRMLMDFLLKLVVSDNGGKN